MKKTLKNPRHIQQGDVLIRLIDTLPADAVPMARENGRAVLAHGEHTGHWHGTEDANLTVFTSPSTGKMFIQNFAVAALPIRHAEHGIVTIPPQGVAQIGQVREKDYFSDMVRPVQD